MKQIKVFILYIVILIYKKHLTYTHNIEPMQIHVWFKT